MLNILKIDGVEDVLTGAEPANLLDPAESHTVDVTQTQERYF